ncbi:hypothetical protein ACHAWX_003352 [Stephanocyclus meneghinianus]
MSATTNRVHLPLASFVTKFSKRMAPLQTPLSSTESPSPNRFHSRKKSSVPSSIHASDSSPSDTYDRALQNATAFDAYYNLDSDAWRSRQRSLIKLNPMKPYPRSPPNLIRPSPNYHSNFFPCYAHTGRIGPPSLPRDTVLIHDADSISKMRTAAKLARKLLDYACHPSVACVGTTTEQIDSLIRDAALANSAYPSPLNYMGFPKSVCSSINEVVCHGIPDTRPLKSGDVVSFDVSCYVGGVHGDNCATIIVGDSDHANGHLLERSGNTPLLEQSTLRKSREDLTSPYLQKDWRSVAYKTKFDSDEEEERFVTARRLVQAAIESRDEGVRACKPGACLSDVGAAIHAVADAYGYDTVRHYRGHGISSDFHCAPFVKHFRNNEKLQLIPGMIFTIEPMITEGTADCQEWDDDWTVLTKDGGRAAQFEHTVLITETGVEVLTAP